MNYQDPISIKNYLHSAGLRPKQYLGQNFLVDEIALQEIVDAAEIKKSDLVLEVGPGLGVLTQELASKAARVVTVEKDRTLLPLLKDFLSEYKNVEIINQDILKFHVKEKITGKYKVVANIPYYLTSFLLQYFLMQENKPTSMVLMIQKEVGERVVASAGELSILGISVQLFADAEIMAVVPKTSFWPVPKVDSVILKIIPKKKYPKIKDEKLFFRIVKVAFAGKRKQIHNTLATGFNLSKEQVRSWLEGSNIDHSARPQDLELTQWEALYVNYPITSA